MKTVLCANSSILSEMAQAGVAWYNTLRYVFVTEACIPFGPAPDMESGGGVCDKCFPLYYLCWLYNTDYNSNIIEEVRQQSSWTVWNDTQFSVVVIVVVVVFSFSCMDNTFNLMCTILLLICELTSTSLFSCARCMLKGCQGHLLGF